MVSLAGPRGERALSDAGHLREDAWLSGVLGYRVVRLAPSPDAVRAVADADERLLAYTSVPADDVAATAALTAAGMFVVDTALTLAADGGLPGAGPVEGVEVAPATPADAEAVGALAARELRTSRFHLDPWIADAEADAIKRAWARNSVLGGRGLEVLVARRDGRLAGFLAVVADGADRVIDLVAVDGEARRAGVGRALARAFAVRHGAAGTLRVGTQASNVTSLGFYAALGFRPVAAHHVLHLHRGADG